MLKSVLLLFLFSITLPAQYNPIIDYSQSKVQFEIGSDKLIFQACGEAILKINFQKNGIADPPTLVMLDTQFNFSGAFIDINQNVLNLSTATFYLDIDLTDLSFELFDNSGNKQIDFSTLENIGEYHFDAGIQNADYYGIYNKDSGYLTNSSGGYIDARSQGGAGAPFFWSTKGLGILVDTDGGEINIGTNNLSIIRNDQQQKRDLDLYFIFGTPKEIFKGLTTVSGNAPLFPKYTLGFMNTEWGLDENELRNDISTYRSKGIPIDAYVLDFDWMAWGENNYGEFRWGNKFPGGPNGSLKSFITSNNMHLMGIRKPRVHVNTIQGGYVSSHNLEYDIVTDYWSNQQVYRLDFRIDATRLWFYDKFVNEGNAYETGITGYWNDEADEYGGNFMFMQMQRANYEGQRNYNNQRVWSINRNFYLGSQRYGYAHWSGDIATGFASMARQRLFMLTSINLGSAWWGMDIGGFHSGTPTPENYYRWIQFGTFVPVFRVHGGFNEEREPWHYGPLAEEIAKRYIRMRYELLPYIYNCAWVNHLEGTPLVRPFVMEYPDDPLSRQYYEGYFFGDDIIVYPVVNPGVTEKQIYIPAGVWVDYFTGEKIYGPANYNYVLHNNDIPVFIKEGSVIPKKNAGDYVDDPAIDSTLIFECYTGANGSTTLYEDDGLTYDYEAGNFSKTEISFISTNEIAKLIINPRAGSFSSPTNNILTKLKSLTEEPDSIYLNNQKLNPTSIDSLLNYDIEGWYFNSFLNECTIKLLYDGSGYELLAYIAEDLQAPQVDSIQLESSTKLNIYFSEAVLTDNSDHSALNPNNYTISNGISIDSIKSEADRSVIHLFTSEHFKNTEYEITIENIADIAASNNIMDSVSFSYSYDPLFHVFLQNGINGYTGTSDSHIAEWFPNNNMGGNDNMECGRFAGDREDDKSILIKFNLLPLGTDTAMVVDAKLSLTLTDNRNGSPAKMIGVYRLLKDWNEGDKAAGMDGDVASNGEVTWVSAKHNQVLWHNSGADFVSNPSDEITVGSFIGSEYSWKIKDLVKFWIANPDSNFGMILREEEPSNLNGTKVFASSEFDVTDIRPKLILIFSDSITVDVKEKIEAALPNEFALNQNYPNPFNPSTQIRYSLKENSRVTIDVFDILGRKVKTLIDEFKNAGHYETIWTGINDQTSKVSSGVYICVMKAGNYFEARKMVYLK